ncbi:MAG: hypothetical protein J2P31_07095 [Blastocatellia bacterium]|nr:hypothetical protein [Blastocatellia bacterium]
MTTNKDLSILKWVGIILACLSTVFTLTIVGSHLAGRLVGWGRVGIIGTVGAEVMVITCAWFVESQRKRVAFVAMLCQIVLTGVLLANASIALDLDWRETLAGKEAERQLATGKQVEEERRRTLEKRAELALQLVEKDRRLARAFVRAEMSPETEGNEAHVTTEQHFASLDVRKLTIYERYGLTVFPLFLALLTFISLAIAAQSGTDPKSVDPPKLLDLMASIAMNSATPSLDAGTNSRKVKKEPAGSVSILPSGASKKKSLTIGRYQFRRDIVGWRCFEVAGRKRPYLGYLSRAAYEEMQTEAPSKEELAAKLIEWADRKRISQ